MMETTYTTTLTHGTSAIFLLPPERKLVWLTYSRSHRGWFTYSQTILTCRIDNTWVVTDYEMPIDPHDVWELAKIQEVSK